jgi:hypothetical protein
MSMRKLASFCLPLAITLAFVVPCFAQTQYRLEVFGGVSKPFDKGFEITAPQSQTPLRGTQTFSMGGVGGVRLGADGNKHWGQDLIYSYSSNASDIVNQTTNTHFAMTARTHILMYNILWYPASIGTPGKSGVFPYLTAGAGGIIHTLPKTTINEALDPNRAGLGQLRGENVFAINAGGGVRFRINKVYGFRVDVRDYMSRAVRYGLPEKSSDPKATVFPISGATHQLEVTFAFVYYF